LPLFVEFEEKVFLWVQEIELDLEKGARIV